MSVFKVDSFECIEFELPAGGRKTATVTVPPFDCWNLQEVADINARIQQATSEGNTPLFYDVRIYLEYFADGAEAKAAIDALVPRQLKQIDEQMAKESAITLGESVPAIGSSSEVMSD